MAYLLDPPFVGLVVFVFYSYTQAAVSVVIHICAHVLKFLQDPFLGVKLLGQGWMRSAFGQILPTVLQKGCTGLHTHNHVREVCAGQNFLAFANLMDKTIDLISISIASEIAPLFMCSLASCVFSCGIYIDVKCEAGTKLYFVSRIQSNKLSSPSQQF